MSAITGQIPPLVLPPPAFPASSSIFEANMERIDRNQDDGYVPEQDEAKLLHELRMQIYEQQRNDIVKLFAECFQTTSFGAPQFILEKWKENQSTIHQKCEDLRVSLEPYLSLIKSSPSSSDLAQSTTVSAVHLSGQASPKANAPKSPKQPPFVPDSIVKNNDIANYVGLYFAMQKQITQCEKAYAKAFPIDLSDLANALNEILKISRKQLEVVGSEFLRFIRTAFDMIPIPKKGNCFPECIARALLMNNDSRYSHIVDPAELAKILRQDVCKFMEGKADKYGAFIVVSPDDKVYEGTNLEERYEKFRQDLMKEGKFFSNESIQPMADMLGRYQFRIYCPDSVKVEDNQILVKDGWVFGNRDQDAPVIHILYTKWGLHYSLLTPKVNKA